MILEKLYRTSIADLNETSDSPATDARLIIEFVLGLNDTAFILASKSEISLNQEQKIAEFIKQRKAGRPVAYIIGKREFYGHSFFTEEGVLVPQPDTETLVEEAVKSIEKDFLGKDFSILDVCAGTGCIGISVALEAVKNCKNTNLTLSDISTKAVEVFSRNSEILLKDSTVELTKCIGNMFDTVRDRKFNMIVSNPPYIETDEISLLPADVLAEPQLALDGGKDGLDFVRILAKEAGNHLQEHGILLIEIGHNQGDRTKTILEQNGWNNIVTVKDLGGRDRVVKCNK